MKVLLIHYRYSVLGGPERYLFNIKELLEEKGHEVIPFSIAYKENKETKYSSYFVKPLSDEFHLHKISKISFTAINAGRELFYNSRAYDNLNKLIKDTKPDIAYILKFSKLSISVLKSLKEAKIPIIVRISDFSYYCSRGVFMKKGLTCEKCLIGSYNRIVYKCKNNSYILSIIDYFRRFIEEKSGFYKYVDELIIPASFTANFFKEYPVFSRAIISQIPTFTYSKAIFICDDRIIKERLKQKKIVIFGRVSEEKGIEILIKALPKIMENNNFEFATHIVGFQDSEYSNKLKSYIIESSLPSIYCHDFLSINDLNELLKISTVAIIPSVCYDNMPNSLIEAQANGVPVIASNIGSFPEMVINGYNGYLFNNRDSIDLADKISDLLSLDEDSYINLCENSINWVNDYCSREKHYEKLISVFKKYVYESH